MAISVTFTSTVSATARTPGCLRFLHGTNEKLVTSIIHYGISREIAISVGGSGEFCVTHDPELAVLFASMAPSGGGRLATLGLDLPQLVFEKLLKNSLIEPLEGVGFQFSPPTFSTLNAEMTNITVTYHESE